MGDIADVRSLYLFDKRAAAIRKMTGYGTGQGSGRLALPLQQQPTLGESLPEQNARRGCNEGPRAIHFHFNDGRKGKTPMHQLNAQMVCPCSSEPPDENSIGRMTLSRPEALNAIDVRMRVERDLLLDQTRHSQAPRVGRPYLGRMRGGARRRTHELPPDAIGTLAFVSDYPGFSWPISPTRRDPA
jgi:hypothetical protein